MEFAGKKERVKTVQAALGLVVDGVDGPRTWSAIEASLKDKIKSPAPVQQSNNTFAEKLIALAKKEIGVEEVNGTNCGPRVNEYKAATWLDHTKSWPWCAAFICWLFREAMKGGTYSFKRPETAGAFDFENWARDQGSSIILKKPHGGDIRPGDIVVFNFSHIGIAIGSPDSTGFVKTIEGNTDGAGSREGGAVLEKRRKISTIRSIIRVK